MLERKIFCPSCRTKMILQWEPMYQKSDVQKCDKCDLNFQIVNGRIKLCYEGGYKINPETGEKYIA